MPFMGLLGRLRGLRTIDRKRLSRRLLGAAGFAPPPRVPTTVNWQLTYACPLRCEHCYSESGRRPPRHLPLESLLRIADVLTALRPMPNFAFSGGEPTLAPGYLELARHLRSRGARVKLYTCGFKLKREAIDAISSTFSVVAVSIDGADSIVNDYVRGKAGAFDEALRTLKILDEVSAVRGRARFGVEFSVMRSNVHQLDQFCVDVAPRFPRLAFVHFGAVVPAGLASRPDYVERELLDATEMTALAARAATLSRLVPRRTEVRVYSNLAFMMHPEQVRHGRSCDIILEIEADGGVRAMSMYEGVVGNLLDEPFDTLWQRTLARQRDPEVVSILSRVSSMQDWGVAARAIDDRFAGKAERSRLAERPSVAAAPRELGASDAAVSTRGRALRVLWP
jgi:MoaA/NifB/PqqE/SkfB family radical SAM enzyme